MSINTTMKKINNPWVILGLEPGAAKKEVKLAYKSMALKHTLTKAARSLNG